MNPDEEQQGQVLKKALELVEKEAKLRDMFEQISAGIGPVSTVRNVSVNPDSFEIDFGGPRKSAKIYCDFGNLAEAKLKVRNAIELNKYVSDQQEVK